ncbi:MAG: ACP S-malonyltransferase [Alphaproteobacteria bacterium]|nr:ACP S-malonyltransferase [Alphaproteobacteria bacterium]
MTAETSGRAIVFPGQGSQAVGMGRALADGYQVARDVFAEVDEALGDSLSKVMFEGPEDALTLTRNAQPALMAMSTAALRVLESETGKSVDQFADCVAGHSLGEYSALAAAGALDLGDAARLLRLRGESMQVAVPVGEGAMAALLGAELGTAREIAAEAASQGVCDLANDNAPGQVVLSGAKPAIEAAITLASERGIRKAVMLPVSAPFHCSLMRPAAERMAEALSDVIIREPLIPLVANVLAAPVLGGPDEIRARLVEQVTAMVRWRESVLWMGGNGITAILEVGAGKVLTGLHKRIDRNIAASAFGGPDDVVAAVEAIAAEN